MVVADDCPAPKSSIRRLSHTHSIVAVKAAMYSASQLEVATVGFFLLSHETHALPSMKQKLLVDTRVLSQPAQLESEKHVSLAAMIPPWDKTT